MLPSRPLRPIDDSRSRGAHARCVCVFPHLDMSTPGDLHGEMIE